MGLDQFAYVADHAGQKDEFWEGAEMDENKTTLDSMSVFVNPKVARPREISYWRKHPNLQGWMEKLWHERSGEECTDEECSFNGVELELFREDIDRLEEDIKSGAMAQLGTTGFFFGDPADSRYYKFDIEFCKMARAELFFGLRVFYNSSW